MRLMPRWVRAMSILMTVQTNLLSLIFLMTYNTITGAELWIINAVLSSLFSYFILYMSLKSVSASVSTFVQNSKTSIDVLKKL